MLLARERIFYEGIVSIEGFSLSDCKRIPYPHRYFVNYLIRTADIIVVIMLLNKKHAKFQSYPIIR